MRAATALDALHTARMAWERSQPQYVLFTLDALELTHQEPQDAPVRTTTAVVASSATQSGVSVPVGQLERAQPGGQRVSSLPNPTPPTSARRPPEGALDNIEGGGARCLAKRAAPTGGL